MNKFIHALANPFAFLITLFSQKNNAFRVGNIYFYRNAKIQLWHKSEGGWCFYANHYHFNLFADHFPSASEADASAKRLVDTILDADVLHIANVE